MGSGTTEQGSATEHESVMRILESSIRGASYEDVFSIIPIVNHFAELAQDSEITCSGNWDRRLAFTTMHRESSRLALWTLLELCHGS